MYKRNQAIAIAKLKAKRKRKKHGTPLPSFEVPWLLPHFHGVRESLLEVGYSSEFVRPPQFPPSLFVLSLLLNLIHFFPHPLLQQLKCRMYFPILPLSLMAIVDSKDGLHIQAACEAYRCSGFGWDGVGRHSFMKDPFASFLILNFFGCIFSAVAIMFSLSDFHEA